MSLSRNAKAAVAASALALLSACAEGASAKGMTLTPADLSGPPDPGLANAVGIAEVGGGQETNPMFSSKIDDASFRAALVESLRLAGLLCETENAPLVLQARLVRLEQPLLGFDMTVTSVVHYTVRDARTGEALVDEDVAAAHTATLGDAFYGPTRLRLANEGSARRNIAALVARLKAIRVVAPAVAVPSS